jgi:hypothetical protein
MKFPLALIIGVAIWLAAAPALAEEGMWTFDAPPAQAMARDLGVRVDQAFLDRLRGASVRLTTGCSGAVVSREGLVLTNQHCVLACAQGLSGPADYVRDGFLTDAREEERACPGMEAEVLDAIFDVTEPINDASYRKYGEAYVVARQGAIDKAERDACGRDPTLRCQVISFYGGGQFKVYKYRRYDDVRLVFSPEFDAAFFGGDPDNFVFPRFDLDCAFLRLYENGRPATTPNSLAWSADPPKAGEAVFVSGNPAGTERAATVSQLQAERDIALPITTRQRAELLARLRVFGEKDAESRRLVSDPIFDQENDLKVLRGRLEALSAPGFLETRQRQEDDLKARLALAPAVAAKVGDPWAEIAVADAGYADLFPVWRQMESAAGGGSQLFAWARTLVRAAAERPKPTAQRLPDYADSRLALVAKSVLDPRPVSADLERLYLEVWFDQTREVLGPNASVTVLMLGGDTPKVLADRLVAGSRLADPAVRRALWEGGAAAIAASNDPMIAYVLRTDPTARAARELWEDRVEGPVDRAAEQVARARFALGGEGLYPDATFSLRLSYGTVAGWGEGKARVAPFTTLSGLYARATDQEPLRLPPRWLAAKSQLDPATVLNFTTTNDITGGSSGSPVVDAEGRVIGAAFDGDAASIAADFAYDPAGDRAIAVSTAAITQALARVYGRDGLVKELMAR